MASEEPPKRTGPAGPKKKVDVVVPPSDATKYLPYALVALVVVSLVGVILRVPAHATLAATALMSLGAVGIAWLAWQDTHTLPPEDNFRKLAAVATVGVALAIVGTVVMTFHPPAPAGSVTFQRAGDSGTITVAGAGANLYVQTSGTFAPDVGPSARASYVLVVTRGRDTEEVEGEFERSAGENPMSGGNMAAAASTESTAHRHALSKLRGPGTYTVALDRIHENLRPPMRAVIYAEPLAPWMFAVLFALLAAVVLAVDAGVARRNVEPTYAPALLFALAMTYYLHGHFAGANVSEGLFASFLVGLLGGGLGGELVARVTRKLGA